MKNGIKGLLIFTFFVFFGSVNLPAQKANIKTTVDSTSILLRNEKNHALKLDEQASRKILPLAYYNFTSSLNASFTFIDSSNRITSQSDYSYFFDNTSNFFALKESYQSKNKTRTVLWIEELKDSIGFKSNMNDSIKTLVYRRLQNFNVAGMKQATAKVNPMLCCKKTGASKTILGVLCEEYVLDNETTKNTFWVTVNNDPWLSKIRKDLQFSAFNELTAYSSGLVMLSECYYKQTKHTQRFEVLDMKRNASKRIITDGIKLVGGF